MSASGAPARGGRADAARAATDPWHRAFVLVVLLLLGAGLRVGAIFTVGDVPSLHGDEAYYVTQAASLARGEGHPGAMRPPGFPAFLAVVTRLTGGELRQLRLAQLVVSLLAIAVVFDLVVRRFSLGAGALSGLLVAASPDQVHFTHFLWAECLVTALLLLSVWLLDQARSSRRLTIVAAAAVVSAAAALTREMALYLVPLFALWLARESRWGWRRPVLFVAVVGACIAPWTWRNFLYFDRLVPISTNHWYPIADGNLMLAAEPVRRMRELRERYNGNPDELEREAEARAIALAAIAEQQPWWILKKLGLNLYVLFAPTRSQLGRFAEREWLPSSWAWLAGGILPAEALIYSLGMVLGIAGLWLVADPALKSLVLAVLGVFVMIYVAGNAASRFRAPLMPFLLLYAGPLCAGYVDHARWRRFGAAATLAAFLVVVTIALFVSPRIRSQYAQVAPAHPAPGADRCCGCVDSPTCRLEPSRQSSYSTRTTTNHG